MVSKHYDFSVQNTELWKLDKLFNFSERMFNILVDYEYN